MTSTVRKPTSLEQFLALPETKPATEFINGQPMQKPMPQGEHSLLQGRLVAIINQVAQPGRIALAFPELRCVFGGDVFVPDIAVFRWERIPRLSSGRIANHFDIHPDWVIEILSPDQPYKQVLGKLLKCAQQGTELGWLVDVTDESILTVDRERRLTELTGDTPLPVLPGIELVLTPAQVFHWLNLA